MDKMKGFKQAKKESAKSDFDGNKVSRHLGCAIYYKGELLALGHNSEKTSPIQHKYNRVRYTCESSPAKTHAEIMALKKIMNLDIDFNKVSIFTYRENDKGIEAMAKPCPACEKLIRELGIRRINYTVENGYASIKLNA